MKPGLRVALVASLVAVQLGMAQPAEKRKNYSQYYAFGSVGGSFGDGESVGVSQLGAGVEGGFYRGLGASCDVGYLFAGRQFGQGIGTVSPGALYQFSPEKKTVPFLIGGYTLGFRAGTGNMLHFGGGATYWVREKLGLRIEARDHFPLDTSGTQFHIFVMRAGITWR